MIAATKRPKLMHQSKANCKLQTLHELIGSLSHYLHGFLHPRWLALGCVEPINSCHCCCSMISPFSEMAATWTCLTGNKSLAERDQVPTGYQLSAAVMGNMPLVFQNPHVVQPTRCFCCAGTVVLDVDAPSSANALGCLEQ